MNLLLQLIFIFYLGCTAGWLVELVYRRIVHGKWVNPGILSGPYLPIYGFGLVLMTAIYTLLKNTLLSPVVIILFMGLTMTLMELIGGKIGLKNNVRLWDYSNRWLNYKGLICPLFSIIWTIIGGIYYFFLADKISDALRWFNENPAFSFILGVFIGLIAIDAFYSFRVYSKIKKYAKENDIIVKYEQLKLDIKERQKAIKEKYSFLTPFSQTQSLKNYLDIHKEGFQIRRCAIKKRRRGRKRK